MEPVAEDHTVFVEANTVGGPPTTVTVEWSQPEPRRQAMCAAEAGAGGVTRTGWRGPDGPERIPHIKH